MVDSEPAASATVPGSLPDRAPTLRVTTPGQFELSGSVTTPWIARLRAAGLAALRGSGPDAVGADDTPGAASIALDQVTRIDSAGLALLIDWLAFVQQSGRQLKYSGGPPTLRALARLSDVEQLIYAS